jgi:hypothetical protein
MAQAANPEGNLEGGRQASIGNLPIWFGDAKKDTFTAEGYIDRVDAARVVLDWNANRTIIFFKTALRSSAIAWFKGLKWRGIDVDDWDAVKKDFIVQYGLTRTARSTTTSMQDMAMKADERVIDYANRMLQLVEDLSILTPPGDIEALTQNETITGLAGYGAVPDANKRAAVLHLVRPAIAYTLKSVAKNIFIAGLNEPYRTEVMKTETIPTLDRAIEIAVHIEIARGQRSLKVHEVANDASDVVPSRRDDRYRAGGSRRRDERYRAGTRTASGHRTTQEVYGMTQEAEDHDETCHDPRDDEDHGELEELDEMKEEISAIKARMGKFQQKRCRYCQLFGHFQAECKKRITDRAPMVTWDNKPYSSQSQGQRRGIERQKNSFKKIHEVDASENQTYEDPEEAEIQTLSLNY